MEVLKDLAGAEDLLLDAELPNTVVQSRGGNDYDITKINADTIPYTGTFGQSGMQSIKAKIDTGLELRNSVSRDTIAYLKLENGLVFNTIDVLGYYSKGDGGGGTFYWDSTSIETDNGGTIIQATGITTGRWKRVYSGVVNVKWFGAKGDGVTDDTIAIQNAINMSKEVFLATGTYAVTTLSLTIGVNISGSAVNVCSLKGIDSTKSLLDYNSGVGQQPSKISLSNFNITGVYNYGFITQGISSELQIDNLHFRGYATKNQVNLSYAFCSVLNKVRVSGNSIEESVVFNQGSNAITVNSMYISISIPIGETKPPVGLLIKGVPPYTSSSNTFNSLAVEGVIVGVKLDAYTYGNTFNSLHTELVKTSMIIGDKTLQQKTSTGTVLNGGFLIATGPVVIELYNSLAGTFQNISFASISAVANQKAFRINWTCSNKISLCNNSGSVFAGIKSKIVVATTSYGPGCILEDWDSEGSGAFKNIVYTKSDSFGNQHIGYIYSASGTPTQRIWTPTVMEY